MALQSIVAKINGQMYNLTYNSSTGKYETTVTAPNVSSFSQPNNKFGVEIVATDEAGNVTTVDRDTESLGEQLQLRVIEHVAPTVGLLYPSNGATLTNNQPTIKWAVTDADSGINADSVSVTINGTVITEGIDMVEIEGGYECSYTPVEVIVDGQQVVKFNASDNDGNASEEKTITFTVDTVPPTLTVTSPVDGVATNKAVVSVTGVTNDATSSPVTVSATVNGGDEIDIPVADDGSFAGDITLSEGENVIVITATDGAGKTSTVTHAVVLDTTAPEITGVVIAPNPVDSGATYVITVTVLD